MRLSNMVAPRALLPVAIFTISASAFWRMPCMARTGVARIDPLVSWNEIAEHTHSIHGGNGFSISAKTDELLASTCTSCAVAEDKSAYWHPSVYFKDAATGKFTLVNQLGGMLAYYLLQPNNGEKNVTAFPKDFEMISGDTNRRNFSYPSPDVEKSLWNKAPYNTQAFLEQAALGFNCLDYSKAPEGSLYRHTLPDKAYLDANCKNGVRFEIMFPSCWNGKHVTSPNKKDHVAFPSLVMTGDCPEGFPVRLPSLFYETIWDTNAFAGVAGEFVIANGDTTGAGYHADFINGWDTKFLQDASNKCTSLSGRVEDCPLFTLQSDDKFSNCKITLPPALKDEKVYEGLTALPGNVPIIDGPGYAHGASPGGQPGGANPPPLPVYSPPPPPVQASPPPPPAPAYSSGTKLPSGSFAPGGVFAAKVTPSGGTPPPTETGTVPPPVIIPVPPTPTPPPPPPPPAPPSRPIYSTEYKTNGNVVQEILWVLEEITVTASVTNTVSVPAPTGPGGYRRRHMLQHKRHGY
ncbi:hypothetical protein HYFRA_00003747 [Hymenoscyphus fraxineus]|uniref:DUF1996 domain-containing protein n=1 Tax=Hymenoscyphus fraxineus TaxID=746836 RepID=A0A9N9KXT6_9HELO|nr:hypothetical protein HYFRA_00003747 [Hymenoscyphus fraxineus]